MFFSAKSETQNFEVHKKMVFSKSVLKARARDAMFWPGMNADIQRARDKCETCWQIAPSQAATPPKFLPKPDYPLQMMSSDYFKLGGTNTW